MSSPTLIKTFTTLHQDRGEREKVLKSCLLLVFQASEFKINENLTRACDGIKYRCCGALNLSAS